MTRRRSPLTIPSAATGRIPRRAFLVGGSAAVVLVAAGCGDDGSDASDTSGDEPGSAGGSAASASASSAVDGAFPVTIEHRHGETTVEEAPRRVFAAGLTDIDPILALGVTPVGFIDWYGDYPAADIRGGLWPWAHDLGAGADITVLPRNDDVFNFEAIAALEPDLIIAQYTGMTSADYETASAIAPVVAQSKDFPDYEAPWDLTTRIIGRALGRTERAEELVAGVEDQFAAARAAHPELAGRTAALVDYFESILYVRGPAEPHGKVLADLGLDYPSEIEALIPSDNVLAELSFEQLELLDTIDVVIVGDFAGTGELTGDPLYQALDVVRQGRVVPGVEPVEGALYWASVLSLPFAIEHLTPMLAVAVDGDPATAVPIP